MDPSRHFKQSSAIRTRDWRPESYMLAFGGLLLLASLSLNIYFAQRTYRGRHAQSLALAKMMADHMLRPGTVVDPIAAKRLGGHEEIVYYQGADIPTVVYIFTPACIWCARNMDNFKALADGQATGYRFIGVSLSDQGLAEYVAKNKLKLPIYSGLSTEAVKQYKLGSTPRTIVISSEGKVLQDWAGAYVGDQKAQVESFFNVTLPGLRELPNAETAKN